MIKLFKPFVHPSAVDLVKSCFESGQLAEGGQVLKFEEELAREFGVRPENVVTTNSCTSALHLCLEHSKRFNGPLKKIISTPLTCAATNMAIIAAGIDIVWADIDPKTLNIDLDDVERKLEGGPVGGFVYVNWGGNRIDRKRLADLCLKYSQEGEQLTVIEDAAHCWSDSLDFSDWEDGDEMHNADFYTCLSTQAIKYLTTGDGGFIIARESNGNKKHLRKMRWFGLDRTKGGFRSNQDIKEWGFKFHMNDVAASIGRANLPYVGDNVKKQKENGRFLRESLDGHPKLKFVEEENSSNWLLTALVEDRKKFEEKVLGAGIEVNQVHQRNDKLTCFSQYKSHLPNMDKVEDKYVVVPSGWWLVQDELDYMVEKIKKGW